MVGVRGFETDLGKNSKLLNTDQKLKKQGHDKSQAGHAKTDTNEGIVKDRSGLNNVDTSSGQDKNIMSAEREHHNNIMKLLAEPDFEKIVKVWKSLPKSLRKGIIAMIDSFSNH